MPFRFQKRISILPGVRINLSKSGASASVGPRGADVNIGPHGVTTNAGIPGTGLSYRKKLGGGAGKLGIGALTVVAGLGAWAYQHAGKVEKAVSAVSLPIAAPQAAGNAPVNTSAANIRYVHRPDSHLRSEAKTSADTLKKEAKGSRLVLISEQDDGWSKVTDGNITGYIRSSVLGKSPPD